jgi:hypothetical protein
MSVNFVYVSQFYLDSSASVPQFGKRVYNALAIPGRNKSRTQGIVGGAIVLRESVG